MDLIGYVRVSTDSQADGYGPDVQEQHIRQWAKHHGHRLTTITSDIGVSGARPPEERPGLAEALNALRPPPKATGLIVDRLDRLARTLTVQEAVLQVAWQAGASVFTVDGGEVMADDPDDPMRTAMRQMAGVFGQLDRALVVKKLRDGRKAKAAAGRHAVGDYRYGTQGQGDGKMRDAVPNPAEQAVVSRIVELRQEGASYRVIAETLDAEGLRPRRAARWSAMSVRNIAERAGATLR
jgi:DNA invertase Pin-like site-specific DNA recombinase